MRSPFRVIAQFRSIVPLGTIMMRIGLVVVGSVAQKVKV